MREGERERVGLFVVNPKPVRPPATAKAKAKAKAEGARMKRATSLRECRGDLGIHLLALAIKSSSLTAPAKRLCRRERKGWRAGWL